MRFLATTTLAVALLAVSVHATAAVSHHETSIYANTRVHETLKNVPRGWVVHSAARQETVLQYRIAVKQNAAGVSELESYVTEHSSNINSERYGQHLTRSQINKLTAPSAESVAAVVSWLSAHGVAHSEMVHTEASDFISFQAAVSVGEKLFSARYNLYQHETTGHQVLRTEAYHLPHIIADHVDFISPATRFPHAQSLARQPSIESVDAEGKFHALANPGGLPSDATPFEDVTELECFNAMSPKCLKEKYLFDSYVVQADGVNSLGVTGYLGQQYSLPNLLMAETTLSAPYVGAGIIGAMPTQYGPGSNTDETNAGIEADLDVQYTTQLTWPTPTVFYNTPGLQPYSDPNTNAGPAASQNEPYSDWLATVLGQDNTPNVVTTSYGDNEDTVSYNYAQRVCTEFLELGAQGVTVVFSSGDGGVAGGQTGTCNGPKKNEFLPTFPAGCPWVTSVGATNLLKDGTETTAAFSSGGFSNYFPRPAYQDMAVPGYLQQFNATIGTAYDGLYNVSGRGVPDVSAFGQNYIVYVALGPSTLGQQAAGPTEVGPIPFPVDGTSCSGPTFASIIALLNDARLAAGKTSLGFINPALYAAAAATATDATATTPATVGTGGVLNDIVTGTNPGCGTKGFPALPGWDPSTGLGSPNFPAMRNFFLTAGVQNATKVYYEPYDSSVFAPNYTGTPDVVTRTPVNQQQQASTGPTTTPVTDSPTDAPTTAAAVPTTAPATVKPTVPAKNTTTNTSPATTATTAVSAVAVVAIASLFAVVA